MAGERAISLAGLLTETERGVSLTAVDLSSSEHRFLARIGNKNVPGSSEDSHSSLRTDRWIFDPEAIEWGNLAILNAPYADLFILDEAGILEFDRGLGWMAGLLRIDRQEDCCSLAVVRPELVETALRRWPEADVLRISRPESKQELALIHRVLGSL